MAMSKKPRKVSRAPGKKTGAKIQQSLAITPLGIKGNKLEIEARMSIVAIARGIATEQDYVNVATVADLCQTITDERHIQTHGESVIRLLLAGKARGYAMTEAEIMSLQTSADVLIEWFHTHGDNIKIAKAALAKMEEIDRGING